MRSAISYRWRGARGDGSLVPFLCLLLMPLVVAVFTVVFLGYALWRLACLLWRSLGLAWQAVRARLDARASRRATTYS